VNQANIIVTLPHDFNTVNNPFVALSREMGEFHQDNKRSERKRGRFFVNFLGRWLARCEGEVRMSGVGFKRARGPA
jgi:hypothetical protein